MVTDKDFGSYRAAANDGGSSARGSAGEAPVFASAEAMGVQTFSFSDLAVAFTLPSGLDLRGPLSLFSGPETRRPAAGQDGPVPAKTLPLGALDHVFARLAGDPL